MLHVPVSGSFATRVGGVFSDPVDPSVHSHPSCSPYPRLPERGMPKADLSSFPEPSQSMSTQACILVLFVHAAALVSIPIHGTEERPKFEPVRRESSLAVFLLAWTPSTRGR